MGSIMYFGVKIISSVMTCEDGRGRAFKKLLSPPPSQMSSVKAVSDVPDPSEKLITRSN